jgi:hypothetical protein
MPKQLDWQLIRDATAKVKTLREEVTRESHTWPNESVHSESVRYLNELEKPLWKSLLKNSQKRRIAYGLALSSMSDCSDKLKEMKDHVKALEKMYSLVHLNKKPPRVDDARMKKSITNSFLKRGLSLKIINDVFINSPQTPPPGFPTSSYVNSFINEKEKLLTERKTELLKSLTATILAEAVAQFNVWAMDDKFRVTVEDIGKWRESSIKNMDTAEFDIYNILLEKNFAKISQASVALADVSQRILDEGLKKGASAQKPAKATDAAALEAWGDISLEIADVLRMALRGVALANFLKYSSGDERTLRDWARNAVKIAYGDALLAGKSNTLSELKKQKLRSGQRISVRGLVNDIIFVQVNKNKSVSLVDIIDNAGNHLSAALPYIKIDSCGLVPGSWVSITGTFDREALKKHLQRVIPKEYNTKIAALNPEGLIIERLNYGELARKSWQHWVTRELSFMFTAVPHGLNISWSWQSGSRGPANQLRYGTWCGR